MKKGDPGGTDNFGELTLPFVSDLKRWADAKMNSQTKTSAKSAAVVFFAGGAAPLALFVSLIYLAAIDPPGSKTIGSFISALFFGVLSLFGTVYMFMRGWRIWSGKEELKEAMPNQPPQRNAGSRPSSGDSSASETPSSLGPRG